MNQLSLILIIAGSAILVAMAIKSLGKSREEREKERRNKNLWRFIAFLLLLGVGITYVIITLPRKKRGVIESVFYGGGKYFFSVRSLDKGNPRYTNGESYEKVKVGDTIIADFRMKLKWKNGYPVFK